MSFSTLEEVFAAFNHLKVLIIGDVMVDSYIHGKVERISPEAPVPVVHIRKKENRLGGAANVALNIQAMGAVPILCSVIGKDANGADFMSLLEKHKLSKTGILESEDRITTVKSRVMSGGHHLMRMDEEDDQNISKTLQNLLYQKIAHLIEEAQVVIFEDYDKGVLTPDLIKAVVELATSKKIPTVVDPKKRNFHAYEGVSLFKPNLKELKEGLNIDIKEVNQANLNKASHQLKEKMNLTGCLLTLSENGMFVDLKQEQYLVPAWIRNISDVSGAGDTVVSVAALGLALQLSPLNLLHLSNLAGGLVCEFAGVVPIQKEQLLSEANKLNVFTPQD